MLSEAPDRRLRMSALADLVVQSRSRLTHTAARLERRGWVARESPASATAAGVELVLTDEGLRRGRRRWPACTSTACAATSSTPCRPSSSPPWAARWTPSPQAITESGAAEGHDAPLASLSPR